jgi:hypothetical protein
MTTNSAPAVILLAALMLFSTTRAGRAEEPVGQWQQLFNGKDLTGWTPKTKATTPARTTPTRSASMTAC